MARVLGLEEVSPGLKSALGSCLRVYDEAVVLPQAHRSTESGGFKNVAIKLSGTEGELTSELFSPNWFSGVSALQIPTDIAEPLIKDPRKRATALAKLVALIPSEMEGAEVQVGPELDGDEHDRDTAPWEAGFDSPGCCVGLYSAQQSRAPDLQVNGMHRIHNTYFLVCKAGGGAAAQTFHSRLVAALGQGRSLDECLKQGESPGPQGLRRVSLAAQRNRARILELAARAIGYHACCARPSPADGTTRRAALTRPAAKVCYRRPTRTRALSCSPTPTPATRSTCVTPPTTAFPSPPTAWATTATR
jgi:hypothetical protein